MKRNAWNIVIDATSLIVFMFMISTGLILKFVLSPGSGRLETALNSQRGFGRTYDLYMGLTRHEWGEVHFYISLAFLTLLIIHLTLHWNWIKGVIFGSEHHPQPKKRKIIAFGIAAFIVLSLIFPFMGNKQSYTKSELIEMRN